MRSELINDFDFMRAKAKPARKESQEQIAFFQYITSAGIEKRFNCRVYHIPNGGARNAITGARLKREGVKKGVFDIAVDKPAKGWHGLKIELKAGKNKLTPEQEEFKRVAESNGYRCEVCYCAAEAIAAVMEYLQ